MSIEQILAILGAIGISGVIPAIVAYFISSRKKKSDAKQKLKEKRYKAILLLCYAFINYEREQTRLVINRPNIASRESLFNELEAEWVNMSLYASDNVIKKMKEFLKVKNQSAFNSLIITMRKDLYGLKSKLAPEIFEM
ncbi:MAG: hypothetical protein JJ971_02935 [Balneolaceae bacterium]|nr:hypothetical protein [Balneolaceae bacterium]MBO6545326.1 hypothetical protein [Balneolaceae bacterium]MBO6646722.1 hypothetical protein [Balneolaceae bacterium]